VNHRLRVPVAVGEKLLFRSPTHRTEFYLESFCITSEKVEWYGKLESGHIGHIVEGRIKDKVNIPTIKGAWMCLAIPIVVHAYSKNSVDFIISLPSSYQAIVSKGDSES
jgi:hypothetical protein